MAQIGGRRHKKRSKKHCSLVLGRIIIFFILCMEIIINILAFIAILAAIFQLGSLPSNPSTGGMNRVIGGRRKHKKRSIKH